MQDHQTNDGLQWYVVMTHPGLERRVHLALGGAGFRTFMPKMRKWISHARVRKAVERPLLSRYIFLEANWQRQSLSAVTEMHGVTAVLSSFDGEQITPEPISQDFIDDFLYRQLAGEWDFVAQDVLPAGARVRIVEGRYDDALAIISHIAGGKAVVKLIGERAEFRISTASLRAA